ncbi:MAG: hypothetical protein LUH05_04120 [Candidatus Gastranaerophilales bacterium]|nr:hypothetical protein [Candidatus Gastranaerophilales bacterium]
MKIGAGFYNVSDKGNTYISLSLDKEIFELYPQLKKLKFILTEIPQDKRKSDNSPGWSLSMYIPEKQQSDEEIPF